MTTQPTEPPCAERESALVALALGARPGSELAAHLRACPACRRRLRAYRHMRAGLLCGPVLGPADNIFVRLVRLAADRLARGRKTPLRPLAHS